MQQDDEAEENDVYDIGEDYKEKLNRVTAKVNSLGKIFFYVRFFKNGIKKSKTLEEINTEVISDTRLHGCIYYTAYAVSVYLYMNITRLLKRSL